MWGNSLVVVEEKKLQIHGESGTRKIRSMRSKQWVVFDGVDAYRGRNREKGMIGVKRAVVNKKIHHMKGETDGPFQRHLHRRGKKINLDSGGGAKGVAENKKIQNHEDGRCKAFSC
jgi:hypothetical protein